MFPRYNFCKNADNSYHNKATIYIDGRQVLDLSNNIYLDSHGIQLMS